MKRNGISDETEREFNIRRGRTVLLPESITAFNDEDKSSTRGIVPSVSVCDDRRQEVDEICQQENCDRSEQCSNAHLFADFHFLNITRRGATVCALTGEPDERRVG